MNLSMNKALIVSITPYFLEKGLSWFKENIKEVEKSRKTQNFWQDNTIIIAKDESINLSCFLRKIDELGYEKVFKIEDPGDFSKMGGIIEIFPINSKNAIRIDFLGNKIDSIEKLNLIQNETISRKLLTKKLKTQKAFSSLKNIKKGDYLVHLDHGIGKLKEITEYYVLKYAKNDTLYVPKGLERKLSLYVGFREPKLSGLSSSLWQKQKRKIKQETEKFAKELLKIFAEKKLSKRDPYQQRELQDILDSTFEHILTSDQEQAIKDIEKDLRKQIPMDRLICGDVGFGKTEVALRAATRVAENNKQVALIAPTTILAKQHYENFQKRMKNIPLKIGMLSRLTKNKKEIKQLLEQGQIDILIGTHSVLSKHINFKNLGLLIIDDEQKFGVKQKELLRERKPCLDVLSLSATPIPRTLYMALSSLRDISLIQTPPKGRQPIKTSVLAFKKEIIKKAIENELKRKGQIYFLHNRVGTIQAVKQFLQDLNTKAKIGILHAKLPENQIISVLNNFQTKKFDLLLSTTIIENGIDIPNVNTLIVDNATKLGLAQSYQLRGRVGRSNKQAYSYFFYPKKGLRGKAKQRLKALQEAEELGSGYQIALRDLEIRQAGNVLGKEQSGSVNKVGLNLYCLMLSQAIEKISLKQF